MLTYPFELFLQVGKVVAVADAEELVSELVLWNDGTRWVRRAYGQHSRGALGMLHTPAVFVSFCHANGRTCVLELLRRKTVRE